MKKKLRGCLNFGKCTVYKPWEFSESALEEVVKIAGRGVLLKEFRGRMV